jgi:hypothetical protein
MNKPYYALVKVPHLLNLKEAFGVPVAPNKVNGTSGSFELQIIVPLRATVPPEFKVAVNVETHVIVPARACGDPPGLLTLKSPVNVLIKIIVPFKV